MFTPFDPFRGLPSSTAVHFDVVRFDDHFEVHVDLPGVDPESIDLTIDGRDLTLSAERVTTVPEGATVVSRGRSTGPVSRRFHLGQRLDTSAVSADYANGVLTVHIAIAETAKPRKITVGAAPAAIDTPAEATHPA